MSAFEIFESLGSEPRLKIMMFLLENGQPTTVTEVAEAVSGTAANISRHLTQLKRSGVVEVKAAGSLRLYTVPQWAAEMIYNASRQSAGIKKGCSGKGAVLD